MIENYSLAFIRAQLLANPSTEEVATELNVTSIELQQYLAQFVYMKEPVTVEFFKKPELRDFIRDSRDYYSRPKTGEFTIADYSLKQVHALIHISVSAKKVAEALGVSQYILINQLRNYSYEGKTLTFEQWQKLTFEEAQNEWGPQYTELLKKNIKRLSDCTFAEVHSHIRKNQTVYWAALSLGASDKDLRIFIAKSQLKLTYEFLKEKTEDELKSQFGDAYDKPIEVSDIKCSELTLAKIHAEILASKKIHPAANNLGTQGETLRKHLAYVSYNDAPLTFEKLIKLKITEAEDFWKENYNKPLKEIYTWPPCKRTRKRKHAEVMVDESDNESRQEPPPLPVPVAGHYSAGSSSFFKTPVIKDNTFSLLFADYAKAHQS